MCACTPLRLFICFFTAQQHIKAINSANQVFNKNQIRLAGKKVDTTYQVIIRPFLLKEKKRQRKFMNIRVHLWKMVSAVVAGSSTTQLDALSQRAFSEPDWISGVSRLLTHTRTPCLHNGVRLKERKFIKLQNEWNVLWYLKWRHARYYGLTKNFQFCCLPCRTIYLFFFVEYSIHDFKICVY